MEQLFIPLNRQPPIRLSCTFIPCPTNIRPSPSITLTIFLSGIDNPQKWWIPTISHLATINSLTTPMLIYDHPGCGTSTDRNPDVEIQERPRGHGRDLLDAARDLRELVISIGKLKLNIEEKDIEKLRIVFVANSIGVAIARLYAQEYPRTVSGFLILDSTIANSDTISIFPDPDASGFDERKLPPGVTASMCKETREKIGKGYHILGPTREGLWRGTISTLLPYADRPKLKGPTEQTPYVTVVEHDMEYFPKIMETQGLGVPEIMIRLYFDPCWHEYNLGLAQLTKPHLSKGPYEAKGSAHVVQRDDPKLVAWELAEILDKLSLQETASHI
ncbi:hypothetical protein N431DRAFT_416186 [Stipitochalara longipes BDJ]|nr:hypothetical protein N431DRAFT_416186 [Stipitochalara longipes BDJ]